ncbi:hypothetical protein BX285_0317 [Streptomyces sp. 1114.5]|uniref:hypothetical protein n=1 Tax=Streptomyces sp. 1114.5 TaxID=1938830 RepID=UPI000EB034EC|nr:hypothetical protein [Streptomyces sp. 1114.5]RKT15993.1 hypothetical protein BX285_0317 [Streptomyces sp. 1114.5]
MSIVRAGITGIMEPTLFASLDHALPVLWERVRDLPIREAHRDFIRICIGPGGGEGVARCLSRGDDWSFTLYVGGMTDWTAHPITITTRPHA